MAVRHGKDGVIKQGSNTIASVTSWKMSEKAATADKSALGDTYESHVIGLLSGDGSIDCLLDPADTAQQALTVGASVTLNLYPQGTTATNKYLTFTATVTGIDFSGSITEPSKRSFSFKANGTITENTA